MTDQQRSAILVLGGEQLEILTDAALRRGVVLGDVSPDDPVSRVAVPAVVVSPAQLAVEATIDMLDSGIEHLAVVDPVRGPARHPRHRRGRCRAHGRLHRGGPPRHAPV